jgi:hypothetical protein
MEVQVEVLIITKMKMLIIKDNLNILSYSFNWPLRYFLFNNNLFNYIIEIKNILFLFIIQFLKEK